LGKYGGIFEPSYFELRRLVRVGGFESDIRLLAPGEFNSNTSELFQMLKKGHHGVKLDPDAWDRLATWIDLNAPCHGTWNEIVGVKKTANDHRRRRELRNLYADLHDDPKIYPEIPEQEIEPVRPKHAHTQAIKAPTVADWPFDATEARQRQKAAGPANRSIDLGNGIKLEFVLIPTGGFVMGSLTGSPDEMPPAAVRIEKPFWMGKFEITNEQYARFDPAHDSRFEHKGSWVFSEGHLGWRLNHPKQPVVRVSWKEAMQFCRWLSEKTGQKINLPTEAHWEWACRAGADSAMHYGDLDTDGRYTMDITPRDARFDDKKLVTANVGTYRPNPWSLYDMHGNIAEWTRSAYKPYPYKADDGRNKIGTSAERTVRGGSWRDRPKRCRSAFRLSYPNWQKIYNVGFRVVIQAEKDASSFVKAASTE